MNRLRFVIAAIMALAASQSAFGSTLTFAAALSGSAESPPNASTGTGLATVAIDTVTNMMTVDVNFSGLSGTTTASHIHCCTTAPFSGNAGVATQTPTFTGFPLGVTNGTYLHTFDLTNPTTYNMASGAFFDMNGDNAAQAEQTLINGLEDGEAYLNIHSTLFPGGEIRALLAPVPEPSTLLLSTTALLGLMIARRRR